MAADFTTQDAAAVRAAFAELCGAEPAGDAAGDAYKAALTRAVARLIHRKKPWRVRRDGA